MKLNHLRYYFTRIYTNDEMDRILTSMFAEGLVLESCKGNYLFFKRKEMDKARMQTITIQSSGRIPDEDPDVKEYIQYALQQGWRLLCIGSVESLVPMRRRLYFFTQDATAAPMPPDASAGYFEANRAKSVTFRWILFWGMLMFAVLFTSVPFMTAEGIALPLLLLSVSLTVLTAVSVVMHFNRRAALQNVISGDDVPSFLTRRLRLLEKIMGVGFVLLIIGMIALLFS